jgi:hypothetical protein
MFGGLHAEARDGYRRFIEDGIVTELESPLAGSVENLILGSEQFVDEVRGRVRTRKKTSGLPQLKRIRERPTLEEIIQAVAEECRSDTRRWKRRRRSGSYARGLAAFLARRCYGYPTTAVAEALGYSSPSSVNSSIRRVKRVIPAFRERLDRIERVLEKNLEQT